MGVCVISEAAAPPLSSPKIHWCSQTQTCPKESESERFVVDVRESRLEMLVDSWSCPVDSTIHIVNLNIHHIYKCICTFLNTVSPKGCWSTNIQTVSPLSLQSLLSRLSPRSPLSTRSPKCPVSSLSSSLHHLHRLHCLQGFHCLLCFLCVYPLYCL